MKKKLVALISAATLTGSLLLTPGTAFAAEQPTYEDLTAQQKQAIAMWEAPQKAVQSTAAKPSTLATQAAAASYTSRTSLYRGSFLMWANERVDFGSTLSVVSWSSGFQEAGAVFPNNVTRNGTSRILNTSTKHTWRGSYTVGAGVPTPWGNANVYNATSTATTNVIRGNGWSASWSG